MYYKEIKDKDISLIIGNILRWGVFIALGVALIGGIVFLCRHGSEPSVIQHQAFVEKNVNLLEFLKDTYRGVMAGRGFYIIDLGIILLIATPLSRVLFSLVAFKLEKDNMYVLITLIVLLVIFVSIISGFGG